MYFVVYLIIKCVSLVLISLRQQLHVPFADFAVEKYIGIVHVGQCRHYDIWCFFGFFFSSLHIYKDLYSTLQILDICYQDCFANVKYYIG